MTERLHFHFSLSCIEEGNSNPLLCSCLENRRDRGAWRAAVSGVAQSRTRLSDSAAAAAAGAQRGSFLLLRFVFVCFCYFFLVEVFSKTWRRSARRL